MDIIFEVIVEFVAELYFDFFQNIALKKIVGKGMRRFLTFLCAIVSIGIVACIIAGGFLITDGGKTELIVGIVLECLSAIAILAHILIAIYNGKKKKDNLNDSLLDTIDRDDLDN